jgi:hypothetical protein
MNLVIELGIILAPLIGWQFTVAEFIGGLLMVVLLALFFRPWMRGQIVEAAREQAVKGPGGEHGRPCRRGHERPRTSLAVS